MQRFRVTFRVSMVVEIETVSAEAAYVGAREEVERACGLMSDVLERDSPDYCKTFDVVLHGQGEVQKWKV